MCHVPFQDVVASGMPINDEVVAGKEELGWGDKHAVLALCEALAPFEMSWLASPPTPNQRASLRR